MKSRKWIALALTLIMILAFGACSPKNADTDNGGDTNTDSGTDKSKMVELVVYSQLANFSGDQIGWAAEVLKEKFNVKFTIINELDGTFATRMANGDLGDIVIFGSDGAQYLDAVEAGMLMDWEEDNLLQDFGPYIYENMKTVLEKNRGITDSGKIYGIGHNAARSADSHEAFFYYPHLRWDLYQQLGYPEINTLEDFIPVLEAMHELEPTSDAGTKTYGVSFFPDWDGDMVMMVKSTGALYGYDEFGFGLYDTKTQTFEDCLKEGGMYLRALKFYNTLFQKGLVDPDSMTQTYDDMIAKYTNGVPHFNIFEWMAGPFNTPQHMEEGKLMACVPAKDQKNIVYGLNPFGGNRVWAIGAKSNYPELCMEIINWLSTPEGVLIYNYGPKGVTWDYDEAGNTYLTDIGTQIHVLEKKKETEITYGDYTGFYKDGEFQHNNTIWIRDDVNPDSANNEPYDFKLWNNTLLAETKYDIKEAWREWAGVVKADEYLENNGHISVSIGTSFTMGKRDAELDTTWEQVKMCIRSGSWSAIYANSDAEYDAIVAQMISDAYAYGYEECIEWCEERAAERKATEDAAK